MHNIKVVRLVGIVRPYWHKNRLADLNSAKNDEPERTVTELLNVRDTIFIHVNLLLKRYFEFAIRVT